MATLEDSFSNELAGLGQFKADNRNGWNAGAGDAWWSLLEVKATLSGANGTWVPVKGGASPTHAGSLPFKAPVSPRKLIIQRAYVLTRTVYVPTIAVYDVVGFVNFDTTINTLQTVSSFSLPRWTSGEGLIPMVLVKTAPGAATPTLTLNYTAAGGATSRSTTVTLLSAPAQGQLGHDASEIPLQSGDRGILALVSLQLSATWGGGTACVLLAKPLYAQLTEAVKRSTPIELLGNGSPVLLDSQETFVMVNYVPDAAGIPKFTYLLKVGEL